MPQYVIKSWQVAEYPMDEKGTLVSIKGRSGGLISWILSLLEIDPTVVFTVTQEKVIFEQGSLEGFMQRVINLNKISSTFYGYKKPWKESVMIGIVCGIMTFWLLGMGAVIGVIYYFLSKSLTVGITEIGGVNHSIEFKRSVIEGIKIDETQAAEVCQIIQKLIDQRAIEHSTADVA